jgi:tryptophan halogenase
MQVEFENVRDFIILHYHLTRRDDSPFWDHVRTMPIPDSLERRIALFRHFGRLFLEPAELFREPSWVAVMLGQGVDAEKVDPVLAGMDPAPLRAKLERMRAVIRAGVGAMPAHRDFVTQGARMAKVA